MLIIININVIIKFNINFINIDVKINNNSNNIKRNITTNNNKKNININNNTDMRLYKNEHAIQGKLRFAGE